MAFEGRKRERRNFFLLLKLYHTNPQKLDWKQSSRKGKTIRHKLETTKHLAVAEVLIHLHT